jgi:hypothetical protein
VTTLGIPAALKRLGKTMLAEEQARGTLPDERKLLEKISERIPR